MRDWDWEGSLVMDTDTETRRVGGGWMDGAHDTLG